MRQERLFISFLLSLCCSLITLRYSLNQSLFDDSMHKLYAEHANSANSSQYTLVDLNRHAWFALKLNSDPIIYLNTLKDLLKRVPTYCLEDFYQGDLLSITVSTKACRFARSSLSGRTHKALGLPISLNKASLKDLVAVPRIGPKLAHKMIENRPYQQLDDLLKLPGIGRKRLAQIRTYLTIKPAQKLWSAKTKEINHLKPRKIMSSDASGIRQ